MHHLRLFLALVFCCSIFPVTAMAITNDDRIKAQVETNKALHPSQAEVASALLRSARREEVTGKAWLLRSDSDKDEDITHSMTVLSVYGIVFGNQPVHYRGKVEAALANKPEIASRTMTEILTMIVYNEEPGSRPALEKIINE